MAKGKKTVYFCQNCGYEAGKWLGQCPACKEWNTQAKRNPQTQITILRLNFFNSIFSHLQSAILCIQFSNIIFLNRKNKTGFYWLLY